MTPIAICLPYYRNPAMLSVHLDAWESYSPKVKKNICVVIVDDGSPEPDHALPVIRDVGIEIRLYRITVNIPWNQDGARNLAMKECPAEWALLTDMDHVLDPDQAPRALDMPKERGVYYMPWQRRFDGSDRGRPHPNSYVIHRDDFWSAGGYDEDFAGHYGSDKNFRRCLSVYLKEVPTRDFALTIYRREHVADASTRDWGRGDSEYATWRNPVLHRKAKGPPYVAENPIRFPWERVL
jgi:hypothetical protein